MLGLAIIGTTSILKAIKRSAPSVKRVVLTSSFAAINDRSKGVGTTYSEASDLFVFDFPLGMFFLTDEGVKADWNPMTEAEAYDGPANGYRASKTFAVSS